MNLFGNFTVFGNMSFLATVIASDIFQVALFGPRGFISLGGSVSIPEGFSMRFIVKFFRNPFVMKFSRSRKLFRRGFLTIISFTGFFFAIVIVELLTEGS